MRARSHTTDAELLIALRSNASSAARNLDNVKLVSGGARDSRHRVCMVTRWLRKAHRIASEVVSGHDRAALRDRVTSSDCGHDEKRAADRAED